MNIDRYTKGVLTVIAAALVYISLMLSGQTAAAQGDALRLGAGTRPQPVVVVGWGTLDAAGDIVLTTVKDGQGKPRTDPRLPVRVREMPDDPVAVSLGVTQERPLPVGLTVIAPGHIWEPIRTKVEPAPIKTQPGGGQ